MRKNEKITMDLVRKNKREGKMSSGTKRNSSDLIEMVESAQCGRYYIVNKGKNCSSSKTAM